MAKVDEHQKVAESGAPASPVTGGLGLMPGYSWYYGPQWAYHHSEVEVDRDKVTKATKWPRPRL